MDVIDDEGNLFGVVNIIDVLVVLFVVAIVVAGVALVLGADEEPSPNDDGQDQTELATIHATLDLGTVPDTLAAEISAGDSYSPGGSNNLTITDVHRSPADGGTRVLVRVAIVGEPLNDGVVEYDGAPPRLDRSLEIVTDYYQVKGTIQDVGGVESFSRSEVTAVLLVEDVHESVAKGFEEGMTKRVDDETIAEVTAVDSEPSTLVRVTDDGEVVVAEHPTDRDVTLTLTLQALDTPNGTEFAGQRLRLGETVTIHLDRATIEGRVVTLE